MVDISANTAVNKFVIVFIVKNMWVSNGIYACIKDSTF